MTISFVHKKKKKIESAIFYIVEKKNPASCFWNIMSNSILYLIIKLKRIIFSDSINFFYINIKLIFI